MGLSLSTNEEERPSDFADIGGELGAGRTLALKSGSMEIVPDRRDLNQGLE
jgi:hypothetical protein